MPERAHVLFVISDIGVCDHAAALIRQFAMAGGKVTVANVSGSEFPFSQRKNFDSYPSLCSEDALSSLQCFDAVWLDTPYVKALPEAWRRLPGTVRLVYSGYGIQLTEWQEGHFGLPIFEHIDPIMVSSQSDFDHFIGFGREKLIFSGDPLLYEVSRVSRGKKEPQVVEKILWAPHWTTRWVDGTPGFATWQWSTKPLYKYFRSNPERFLVIRPHPLLNIREGSWKSRRHYRKLIALPNVSVSEESFLADLLRTQVLISDGVSILGYYGALGKPVVFLQNAGAAPPLNENGRKVSASCFPVDSSRGLTRILTHHIFLPDIPCLSRDLPEVVREHFPLFNSSPGKILLDYLDGT
ncbi:hypothetical protein N9H87_04270 [Pontimonas sp.]|nr:hypothetical protein [Pontimonas sp.]MDA8863415.1 hypothetical protein [Pontimonas sp.]